MAEVVQLAKPGPDCPEPGGFVLTDTARDILRSLRLVHEGEDARFTMIAGVPGIGKTRTLAQFAASEEDVAHITFKRGEGKPSDVSEVLFQRYLHWVNPNGMSLPLRRKTLLMEAFGRCRTLIADEAQHMDADGIEWLRGLAEEAGVSIAFAGDLKLPDLINPIPQLRSRMLRPITATRASLGDVQALAGAWSVSDAKVVRALKAVADRDGGLRNVVHVLRVAADFADGGQIAAGHVQAAILDMKLAPKGGK